MLILASIRRDTVASQKAFPCCFYFTFLTHGATARLRTLYIAYRDILPPNESNKTCVCLIRACDTPYASSSSSSHSTLSNAPSPSAYNLSNPVTPSKYPGSLHALNNIPNPSRSYARSTVSQHPVHRS